MFTPQVAALPPLSFVWIKLNFIGGNKSTLNKGGLRVGKVVSITLITHGSPIVQIPVVGMRSPSYSQQQTGGRYVRIMDARDFTMMSCAGPPLLLLSWSCSAALWGGLSRDVHVEWLTRLISSPSPCPPIDPVLSNIQYPKSMRSSLSLSRSTHHTNAIISPKTKTMKLDHIWLINSAHNL